MRANRATSLTQWWVSISHPQTSLGSTFPSAEFFKAPCHYKLNNHNSTVWLLSTSSTYHNEALLHRCCLGLENMRANGYVLTSNRRSRLQLVSDQEFTDCLGTYQTIEYEGCRCKHHGGSNTITNVDICAGAELILWEQKWCDGGI